MVKMIKYHMTVKDVMRNALFIVERCSEEELRKVYYRYKNDSDYEVISAESMLIEVRPIRLSDIENPIM